MREWNINLPIIKTFKIHNSIAVIIPKEIADVQNIYVGTPFEILPDGEDRILLQRVQYVRPPPYGSVWAVSKA